MSKKEEIFLVDLCDGDKRQQQQQPKWLSLSSKEEEEEELGVFQHTHTPSFPLHTNTKISRLWLGLICLSALKMQVSTGQPVVTGSEKLRAKLTSSLSFSPSSHSPPVMLTRPSNWSRKVRTVQPTSQPDWPDCLNGQAALEWKNNNCNGENWAQLNYEDK